MVKVCMLEGLAVLCTAMATSEEQDKLLPGQN